MINNKRIIVSLTSWKKRINNVYPVCISILNNTVIPDSIELNLSYEEFTNKEKDLPTELIQLQNENKIQINWVEKNTKTFKKFIPVLQKYYGEDYLLFTIDDDKIYFKNYIEECLNNFNDCGSFSSSKFGVIIGGRMLYNSKIFEKDFWEKLSDNIIETGVDDTYIYSYLKFKNIKMKQKFLDLCETYNEIEPFGINYYTKNNRIEISRKLSKMVWNYEQ